jgi:hypothetical protein
VTRDEAAAALGTVVTGHWPDPYVGVEVRQAGVLAGVEGDAAVLDLPQGARTTCPVSQVAAGTEVDGCEVRAANYGGVL